MERLSIKVLLAVMCVGAFASEALAANICDRPSIFDKKEIIDRYLKCLKSLNIAQRSDDEKLLVENYHPVSHEMHYNMGPNPDLQELYEVLATYDN